MKNNTRNSKKTILAVDDIPENLDVVKSILTPQYIVQATVKGEIALKIAQKQKPDLILLDIMMPDMDGYEVCQKIKENQVTQDIPVIFLTGQDSITDEFLGLEVGAVDYISKPINPPVLMARIKAHLSLAETRKELKKHKENLEQMVQKKVKQLSNSKLAMIFSLAKLAESRDNETGEHLLRTQDYCKMLANKLKKTDKYQKKINSTFCENIYNASPLHDIGKVGISDSILLKPGKLTKNEFEIVKKHTIIGFDTLNEVQKKYSEGIFINMGIEIVRSHHEKWDGSGYPDGLKGVNIPLSARIMALADVYDALRSKRPYKDAFSHQKSRDIIIDDKGKHFDPVIVDAFLDLEKEFKSFTYEE